VSFSEFLYKLKVYIYIYMCVCVCVCVCVCADSGKWQPRFETYTYRVPLTKVFNEITYPQKKLPILCFHSDELLAWLPFYFPWFCCTNRLIGAGALSIWRSSALPMDFCKALSKSTWRPGTTGILRGTPTWLTLDSNPPLQCIAYGLC
jgi:hypothetical protein